MKGQGGKTVIVFGAFDPLHRGHEAMFQEAKQYGGRLVVVVARDETIRTKKKREPYQREAERCEAVRTAGADEVVLGDRDPEAYGRLRNMDYDILALGYDQPVSEDEARRLLDAVGKTGVEVVRLSAFEPEKYKSSFMRGQDVNCTRSGTRDTIEG